MNYWSLTCDWQNDDNFLSCKISNTFRVDNHLIVDKNCPCKDRYFHNDNEVCSEWYFIKI